MSRTNRFKIVFVAIMLAVSPLVSSSANQQFFGGLHFNVGFPQGDFKTEINRNAYGLGGQFFYSPPTFPLAVGVEVGWMNYGRESRQEPFSTTVPDVTVEVTTSNNLVQGFFVARLQLPDGPIRPYADLLVGFNYLFTETKITSPNDAGDDVASSTNKDDVVFAHGFGAGLMVPIYSYRTEKITSFQILIDGGVRYVYGGYAEYLKKGSIRRANETVIYDTTHSKTDLIRLHIGALIRF
jgi:hypothetical protein